MVIALCQGAGGEGERERENGSQVIDKESER